jgi:hypothetical protein
LVVIAGSRWGGARQNGEESHWDEVTPCRARHGGLSDNLRRSYRTPRAWLSRWTKVQSRYKSPNCRTTLVAESLPIEVQDFLTTFPALTTRTATASAPLQEAVGADDAKRRDGLMSGEARRRMKQLRPNAIAKHEHSCATHGAREFLGADFQGTKTATGMTARCHLAPPAHA